LQVQYMEQQRQLQKLAKEYQTLQMKDVENQVVMKELVEQHEDLLKRYEDNWNLIKVMIGRMVKSYARKR